MIKQVIVMRKDLNMHKGKMVAQGAHASMVAILQQTVHTVNYGDERWELNTTVDSDISIWLNGIFTKVCVSVDSELELLGAYHLAMDAKIPTSIIQDSGKTEFNNIPT